jgi:restriction system protein
VAIPDFESILLPLLKLAADGATHHLADLREKLADQFDLTEAERTELLPSGRQAVFSNRVAWARSDLGVAGLLESPSRGFLRITPRGSQLLASSPGALDRQFLFKYPEFAAARQRVKADSSNEQTVVATTAQASRTARLRSRPPTKPSSAPTRICTPRSPMRYWRASRACHQDSSNG